MFQKVLLTLGPKKCEFQGGLVPPRLWAGDEPGEKVKMKSSSQVLQDHVRLLLSGATSRNSGITVRLFNKYEPLLKVWIWQLFKYKPSHSKTFPNFSIFNLSQKNL